MGCFRPNTPAEWFRVYMELAGAAIFAVIMLLIVIFQHRGLFSAIPADLYDESGPKLVYFGRESCASCKEAEKILIGLDDSKEVYARIKYFDTDLCRDDPLFEQVLKDFRVEEVPYIVKIEDGEYLDGLNLVGEDGRIAVEALYEFLGVSYAVS